MIKKIIDRQMKKMSGKPSLSDLEKILLIVTVHIIRKQSQSYMSNNFQTKSFIYLRGGMS